MLSEKYFIYFHVKMKLANNKSCICLKGGTLQETVGSLKRQRKKIGHGRNILPCNGPPITTTNK